MPEQMTIFCFCYPLKQATSCAIAPSFSSSRTWSIRRSMHDKSEV